MWTGWFPWRFLLSRIARAHGFLDPAPVVDRLERLAQPSEVTAPVELLRAGAVFHARGLVNARVIQYNLDWAWPWWVERQYDPADAAFVPRAFALTHVNLTHRDWTAVGVPDVDRHPLVDPRGLVTPRHDGWSLDAWLVPDRGEPLLPSRAGEAAQELLRAPGGDGAPGLAVETRVAGVAGRLTTRVDAAWEEGAVRLRMRMRAEATSAGWLALALRPANPEGVASLHRLERSGPAALRVDDTTEIQLDRPPDRLRLSDYRRGDVLHALGDGEAAGGGGSEALVCDVGLATGAALFRLDRAGAAEVTARVVLDGEPNGREVGAPGGRGDRSRPWVAALADTARLAVPDPRFSYLWDAALRSLVLHAPGEVYPGPYTYKRFWFRDAAFILDALGVLGLGARARRVLDTFPERQEGSGYFRSQEGEWDANGAALWAMDRYLRRSGEAPPEAWVRSARRGAEWIRRKRLDADLDAPHAGLLPAGFSAEHLGPNDYFYWDDFWCAAGLRAAARVLGEAGEPEAAAGFEAEAGDLLAAVDRSLGRSETHRRTGAVPASPYRRMDAGAVGSLSAGYPLRLWPAADPRLLRTVEHLLEHHTLDGAFFQDMIHSGLNAYLTLHLAQVLLRAGDPRHETLVRAVAGLASATGQWPEAIHPRTRGGCMGDGQHVWASAEWVLALRGWFVREEDGALVLASGVPETWVRSGETIELGPTPTPWGPVTVRVRSAGDGALVEWSAGWRGKPPRIEVRLPGHRPEVPDPRAGGVRLPPVSGPRS